jgi:hypothetical protein
MEQSRYISDPLLAALRRLLPTTDFDMKPTPLANSTEVSLSVELPLPAAAEYAFGLYFQPEKQIHARLLFPNETKYFWYMPFEVGAFDDLDNSFVRAVEQLVRYETRIVQRRGLFADSFRCDFKAGSEWKKVYAHSAFHPGGFHPPIIAGREHVYRSPAIAPQQ